MSRHEKYHLRPLGWETGPPEERRKLTTLDYLSPCVWMNYALFFALDSHTAKTNAVAVLKAGLERTLAQARHLVGTIEADSSGGHSFVKKRDSTVLFTVQWLDGPDDTFPSFAALEEAHFTSASIGDMSVLSNVPMAYGEKPEAHPDRSPAAASFKATIIPGGLVFNMMLHHYSNDVMGWSAFAHQLAENCHAASHYSALPAWDTASLDVSRFQAPDDIPDEAKVNGAPSPERHPDHRPSQALLFHLPKSKAVALKKAAWPTDGSWISTYDAASALVWRTLSRLRVPLYKPEQDAPLLWAEAVDMRRRLHAPALPPRVQGNVWFAAVSAATATPAPLTVAEVASEAPLAHLAGYIRALTNGVTEEGLDKALEAVHRVRDKTALYLRINSFPPMSVAVTDWRDTDMCQADFGFGQPRVFRHLFGLVTEGLVIVYPPRTTDSSSDQGCEFSIAVEEELSRALIEDSAWSEFFEYRGVDVA